MPPNNYSNPNLPSDPYAFMNSQPTGNNRPSPFRPSTTKGRVILIGSFGTFIIIAFVVVMSILGSADRAKSQQYIELAQKQAEIIRLATTGQTTAKSLETKAYATMIKLTMTSSQNEVNKVIDGRGVSVKALSKELTKSKNPQNDALLEEAENNNRFDETFKELIDSEITKFQQQLNSVASGATAAETKILQEAFTNAGLLLAPAKTEA